MDPKDVRDAYTGINKFKGHAEINRVDKTYEVWVPHGNASCVYDEDMYVLWSDCDTLFVGNYGVIGHRPNIDKQLENYRKELRLTRSRVAHAPERAAPGGRLDARPGRPAPACRWQAQ